MHLGLSDDESAALARLLRKAIDDDRYSLSPRMRTLDRLEVAAAENLRATAREAGPAPRSLMIILLGARASSSDPRPR